MFRAALASSAIALIGCLHTPTHHCGSADDCDVGEHCLAVAAGDLRCARDSAFCDSGLAWSDDAGDVGGSCVDGAAPLDWNPCVPQPATTTHTDTCATSVCAADPRCCTREWSDTCVEEADRLCGLSCGAVAAVVGVVETWVGAWYGSEYQAFWADDVMGDAVQAVAWGDYDGDALPDLATCDDGTQVSSVIRIYHNDGGEQFSLAKAASTGTGCWDIDFVDLDADGSLDVVTSGPYEAKWVRNDHGLWADAVTAVATGYLTSLDWADVDGDGRIDALEGRYEDSFQVLRNESTPSGFTPWYDSGDAAAMPRYQTVTWGDVDNVGGIDVLVAGDGFLRVIPNTDSNTFAAGAPLLEGPSADIPAALFLDADEDGDLDVVAFAVNAPLRVFRNDYDGGGGTGFTTTPLWESSAAPFIDTVQTGGMAIGDADGDRHLDLVVCAEGDFCQLWLGQGDGTFTRIWDPGGARQIYAVAVTSDWR